METPTYSVSNNNITIYNSFLIKKKDFKETLEFIANEHPDNKVVKTRFYYSAICEWTVHNFLYNLHLWRSHTINVDINIMKWYQNMGYCILGTLLYLFIK